MRDMTSTGYFTDPLFQAHHTGAHPENADRLVAIQKKLEETGLLKDLLSLEASSATLDLIEPLHDARHLQAMARACEGGGGYLDNDTVVSPKSFEAALRASGAATLAADKILTGELTNAFIASRPPGHHATHNRAMGFCLINHVAVLARYLQKRYNLERILIVDFDVHHGNGTQDLFYDDDTVFYMSTHQSPCYPGTGHREEKGRGKGEGYTANFPLKPGSGDEEVLSMFHNHILLEGLEFQPDFVLVSAGFDAHVRDPLAQLRFSSSVYGELTKILQVIAWNCCDGRLISLLEGGYDPVGLSEGVAEHLKMLRFFEPEAA